MVAVLVAVLAYFQPRGWAMTFVVAYLAHIGADMLTNSGVPLLWPSETRYRLAAMQTGGLVEWIAVSAFIGAWLLGVHAGHVPFAMAMPSL